MKKIYFLFILAIINLNVKAQLTITKTANQPVVGDIVMDASYDSTTAVPKSTGANQNWNFTSFTAGTFTEVMTYTTVASTPAGSLFPTANIAVMRGSNEYEYYNNQAGMISYKGMANTSNTSITTFSDEAVKLNWPTAFNNNNSDGFAGLEVTPTSTTNWNGVISYTASGSGTVTLPNGNVHTNCLQVKSVITLTMSGSNSATMTMVNYEYYSSASRYPILTIEYQAYSSGTVTNNDFNARVNTTALTSGLGEQVNSNDVVVYPNPSSDNITIQLPGNILAEKLEIYDMNGKLVVSKHNSNTLNVSSLTKGLYLLKINAQGSVMQKQVIITE